MHRIKNCKIVWNWRTNTFTYSKEIHKRNDFIYFSRKLLLAFSTAATLGVCNVRTNMGVFYVVFFSKTTPQRKPDWVHDLSMRIELGRYHESHQVLSTTLI